jgi:Zn-dependent protease with chaperone function
MEAMILMSKKLLSFQFIGFLLLFPQVFLIISCFMILVEQPYLRTSYILQIAVIWLFFHIIPLLFEIVSGEKATKVSPNGNNWEMGNYSEKDIRELVAEATKDLPRKFKNIKVSIAPSRFTSAWTLISLIWPSRFKAKNIFISSGSLHYLTKNELKAIILHEIAHNLPQYRVNPFGSMLLADFALHCGVFIVSCEIAISFLETIAIFVIVHSVVIRIVQSLPVGVYREIEYMCDHFSAKNFGKSHITNALLKLGEEDELTDAVISLSAKRLLSCDHLLLEDIYYAFEAVRPYGRIFHSNLFKHVSEVVTLLVPENDTDNSSDAQNKDFLAHLKARKEIKSSRVRWRSFDEPKKGFLSSNEIEKLCTELSSFPDRALVISEDEFSPTTHPKYRDRILFINHVIIKDGVR